MSLQVWLPLNGNLNNQGLSEVTLTNSGATVSTSGKIGSCYLLNSAKLSLTPSFITSFYGDFSFSLWLKVNSFTTSYETYLQIGIGTAPWTSYRIGLLRNAETSNLIFCISDGSSSTQSNCYTSYSAGTWYHFTCTYSKTEQKMRIYKNGVLSNTYSTSIIPKFSDVSYITLGQVNNGSYKTNCLINDFRLYDHCLSAKEVKEISKGLSLHYKLSDPYIESTTNLYNGWSTSCYNGATSKYSYGTSTDMYYDTLDDMIRVRMGTSNLDAWPFVFFNDITPPSNGEYRTLSFDYYPTIKDKVNFYTYNTSGTITWIANGIKGTGGNIPVNTNSWNHISVTIKNTGSSNSGFGYMRIGLEKHTSSTSNYWLFKNIQVESKDHSTPYTTSSRNLNIEYDVSGYGYNGTLSESLPYASSSPRYDGCYYFNSTSKRITLPAINMSGFSNSFSISWWGKAPSYSSLMYWGFSNGNRLNFYSGMYCNTGDGSSNPYYKPNTTTTISTPSVDTWHHFVMVGDGSSNKLYMDGELYGVAKTYKGITGSTIVINGWDSSTSYKTNGYISDFRIYSTALSAEDIKELYNTSASIDKNGNMYAYEFKEE